MLTEFQLAQSSTLDLCLSLQLIVQEIKQLLQQDPQYIGLTHDSVNAVTVDHFLWDYRREHDSETSEVPFHRTRCIFY